MKNYVKEFDGQSVPKGSKYYSKADINQKSYFYDKNYIPVGDKSAFVIRHSDLTELPEAEQEWVPEVGYICEVKESVVGGLATEWSKVYVDSINIKSDSSIQVCCIDDNGDFAIFYPTYDSVKFRPLKTQQEKDREAFIDMAIGLYPLIIPTNDLRKLLGMSFDSGARFTAPKAADNEQK